MREREGREGRMCVCVCVCVCVREGERGGGREVVHNRAYSGKTAAGSKSGQSLTSFCCLSSSYSAILDWYS